MSKKILLADDEEIIHQTLTDYLEELGHQVESCYDGVAAVEALRRGTFDLALVDIWMPGLDGISILQEFQEGPRIALISGHADTEQVVQALRLNAADFLLKPIKLAEVDALLDRPGVSLTLEELPKRPEHPRGYIGESAHAGWVRSQIASVVESGCETVLIEGATGTGKEVVARAIHEQTHGDMERFVALCCPAIPDALIESELFGCSKGAFTGALCDRPGCFEQANGGTLFLDEIADLSLAAQAKLLRVLETRSFRRLGDGKQLHVELRILAASNTPLEQRVREGTFRQDLYYRLNLFHFQLLPLERRREDIFPLASLFLEQSARRRGRDFRGFTPEARVHLAGRAFPGNARELRNLVDRATIRCKGQWVDIADLVPHHAYHGAAPIEPEVATPLPRSHEAEGSERHRILSALNATRWNRRKAAEYLDMPYSTLRYKIQKYGLQ